MFVIVFFVFLNLSVFGSGFVLLCSCLVMGLLIVDC